MPRRRSRLLPVLLILSAAANAFLFLRTHDSADGQRTAAFTRGESRNASADDSRTGASSHDLAYKLEALQRLEDEHLRAARELADVYWSAHDDSQHSYAEAFAAGLESVRAGLVRQLGAEAKADPLFRPLFRPLDQIYWFLTSDEQIGIQKLRLERDLALQAAARAAPLTAEVAAGGAPGLGHEATRAIVEEYQAGLAALLDADTLLEFELRDSAIAEQLRASDVEFTESEFRQVFSLMAGLQGGVTEIDEVRSTRDRLRNILGPQRFALLWAARDPMYADLKRVAARHSLPEGQVLSVYGVTQEFQDRRMALGQQASVNPGRAATDALALAEEERRAIARIVGDDIADEIVRGRALQSFRLFN